LQEYEDTIHVYLIKTDRNKLFINRTASSPTDT